MRSSGTWRPETNFVASPATQAPFIRWPSHRMAATPFREVGTEPFDSGTWRPGRKFASIMDTRVRSEAWLFPPTGDDFFPEVLTRPRGSGMLRTAASCTAWRTTQGRYGL